MCAPLACLAAYTRVCACMHACMRAQAEAMARQVQGMSDGQMKVMMRAAQTVQGAGAAVKRVRDWLAANPLALVAIVVLIIAVLLRLFGYM